MRCIEELLKCLLQIKILQLLKILSSLCINRTLPIMIGLVHYIYIAYYFKENEMLYCG